MTDAAVAALATLAEAGTVDAHGTRYEPYLKGGVVGFKVTTRDGTVGYVYLNPSSEADDGVSNVFLYQGPTGDPAEDGAVCYLDMVECRAEATTV